MSGSAQDRPAIVLESDGELWLGTFGLVVAYLAADLLSDGAQVPDVVIEAGEEGRVAGTLTAATTTHLVIGGRWVEIAENITRFAVC